MRFGFTIWSCYWKICLRIPTSKTSWTTHPIKSVLLMGHIDSVTSSQATGPGDKRYVYLFIYPYVLACSHFIIIQDTIIKDHLEAIGSFLISIILGSDQMTISIATGHTCHWPLATLSFNWKYSQQCSSWALKWCCSTWVPGHTQKCVFWSLLFLYSLSSLGWP